ncbi:hypothetical protein [Kurthia sp. ISK08]|uniref:hypothetical protein n=1 Tax=Kurthia sp. ISK08 TaxID=3385835 RepID=UPI0038FCC658
MSNFKLVKTAAALALGASVVTSAVATTDASAASKYKIKSGKLVYAKSGKVVKGYVTYKSTVYKNGKKLTGLKGKTYYKAGKKATGTYKGAYYVKGVKKVTTGTYNKAYYVKGVKKVSTGLYASKYYKDGKLATGTYKGAYYVKGLKKVTTGTYNGAYYVKGKKVVSTGLYADKLYVAGKLNKGYKLYKEDLYKDAVLNKGLVVFEGKLYDGAKLNEGHKIFKDELYNGSELNTKLALFEGKLYDGAKLNEGIKKFEDKWYNNAELADGTFTIDGKEVAIENGVEVGAKVKSVEAINAQQVKVTFNKSVDKTTAENIANYDVIDASLNVNTSVLDKSGDADDSIVKLQDDKKSVIIDLDPTNANSKALAGKTNYTVKVNKESVKDLAGNYVEAHSTSFVFADTVAPEVTSVKASSTGFTVTFSEPIDITNADKGIVKVNGVNVKATDITAVAGDKYSVKIAYTLVAGTEYSVYTAAFADLVGNKSEATTKTASISTDTTAPTLQSVTQDGDLVVAFKFSEELAAGTTAKIYRDATVFANNVTLVQDDEDETLYTATIPNATVAGVDLYPTGQTSTSVKVELSNFKDVTGNVTAGITKDLTLTRTVKTPVIESTKWDGTRAVIKLDTVLDSTSEVASKLLVTDASGAEVSGLTAEVASDATGTDADGKYIVITGLNADKEYTLNFTKGFAKDKAVVPNETGNYTLSLNTKSSALDKTAPEITTPATDISVTGNVITLKFNETLAASARTLSNFTLDGSALPAGTVVVLTTSVPNTSPVNDTIKITLPEGYVNADANYLLGYKNIADLAGNVADAGSKSITLADTVKPVLTSAVVSSVDGKITLGFSEKITAAADAAADFIVKVNGVTLTSGYTVTTDLTNTKQLIVTVTGVNTIGQTVTVTSINNPTIVKDTAGTPNALTGATLVTATQK